MIVNAAADPSTPVRRFMRLPQLAGVTPDQSQPFTPNAQSSPEARFVRYLDKVLPKLTHALNGGIAFDRLGVTLLEVRATHDAQIAALARQYPEFEAVLGPLLVAACDASESRPGDGLSLPTKIRQHYRHGKRRYGTKNNPGADQAVGATRSPIGLLTSRYNDFPPPFSSALIAPSGRGPGTGRAGVHPPTSPPRVPPGPRSARRGLREVARAEGLRARGWWRHGGRGRRSGGAPERVAARAGGAGGAGGEEGAAHPGVGREGVRPAAAVCQLL